MGDIMKQRNSINRIISLLLLIFQIRFVGYVSNLVNAKGVKSYNKLVENFKNFLIEKNVTDPQHIYEYFNYAMWNGYLSKDCELMYSLDRKVYWNNPGMSIASGEGVCLNFADMLSCIYREFGYKSYVAMCYVDTNNVKIEKIRTDEQIERKIKSGDNEKIEAIFNNFFTDNLTKMLGNHAVTCVEYNGELYIFDPTNLAYLNKTSFNDAHIINGNGKFDLKYFSSILLDNINLFKVISNTNNKNYKLEVINKPELILDLENLENFHTENKDLINEIDNINKRGTKSGLLEIAIYGVLAGIILNCYKDMIKKIALKCKNNEINDIKNISNELKEYFKQHNIITEYEVLRNYELINKKFGIKNSICKDLLRKSILNVNNLINNDIFYNNILVVLLDELNYKSSICYVKKYSNNLPIGNRILIKYKKDNINYYYDPEISELLYEDDKNMLHSKNNKYKYKRNSEQYTFNTLSCKEEIQSKMKEEDILLCKTDFNELKKSKILRKNY